MIEAFKVDKPHWIYVPDNTLNPIFRLTYSHGGYRVPTSELLALTHRVVDAIGQLLDLWPRQLAKDQSRLVKELERVKSKVAKFSFRS